MRYILLLSLLLLSTTAVLAQRGEKPARYLSDPIVIDSASSLMIPLRYNTELLTSNKLTLWNDYYANIIFYDMEEDRSKRLFPEDTFIRGFLTSDVGYNRSASLPANKNMSRDWIFYFVKETDSNANGRIDSDDPYTLYLSDKQGNGLKALTQPLENAVSIKIFDKQGFALVKMQRDANGDKSFTGKDKDFYYVRLDLKTLAFGNKIEISQREGL
jgi:hypothetical protein